MVPDQNLEYLRIPSTDGQNMSYDQIRQAVGVGEIGGGIVNSVTAKCVGFETCRLNMSYICLLTLTYPKIELAESKV